MDIFFGDKLLSFDSRPSCEMVYPNVAPFFANIFPKNDLTHWYYDKQIQQLYESCLLKPYLWEL